MFMLTPSLTSISTFIYSHPHLTLLETQCTTARDLQKLHTHFIKTGLIADTIAASRVLASASTINVNYAYSVFAQIQNKNLFMWNTIIRAFANSSRPEIAVELFVEMLVGAEVEPTSLTYPSILKAYAEMGVGWDGKQVHGRVLKLGVWEDSFVRNTLIHMYMSCGLMFEARKVFDEMTEFDVVAWNSMIMGLGKNGEVVEARRLFDEMGFRKNVVSWNSMISGYVRNGEFAAALELFGKMMEEGKEKEKIQPCEFTMVSLLNACAHLGALRQGEWIHHYMKKKRMKLSPLALTAIVDMYCKCGCIERAARVFHAAADSGRGLSISCWNTMILGLAMNGYADEAIGLFTRLELSNLTPDHVSFVGVLTACNHSGSVDEALKYFSSMISVYNLKPDIKHYTCLVDALGRTGRLREAEELIQGMPVEPDSIIWSSLLSSCRKHGELEMAERAAKSLLKSDPSDTCGYVLMSNVYSSSNRFEEAMEQRLAMKKMKAKKDPGCSLISVNGVVHEFISGGRLHPRSEQIYTMLQLLLENMCEKQTSNKSKS
uniref:Uncharacterized protein n=1 Tax=Kalanchoe fedtschenkoi TaxID=63787 RepID=A0A7N0RJC0_KALFE